MRTGCSAWAIAGTVVLWGGPWASAGDRWSDAVELAARQAGGEVTTIGRSVEGRPLLAVRLRGEGAGAGERRPTLVVIAGLDGRHIAGSRIALGLIERLGRERDAVLRGVDVAVVACGNPDGLSRFEDSRPQQDDGSNAARRGGSREDADRDRRVDEDGPIDVNGDGFITQMRVRRGAAGMLRDLTPSEVGEPVEPRLLRRAEAARGERPEFVLLPEGRDQDGDGLIGEDPARGVDLNANFPYHWPEFEGGAGPYPLSEPETRALADWLLAMPELVAVLEYGPNDNLVSIPEGGKMDATGEAPISGGVLDADRPLFEAASRMFKDATGIGGVGGVTRSFDGSLVGWAYAQLGVQALVTPGWVRPDLVKRSEEAGGAKPAAEADPPTSPAPAKPMPDTEDGRWLAYSDAQVESERGFVDWTVFDHPQLGSVEIGGWKAGFRLNPPPSGPGLEATIEGQWRFVRALAESLPRLEVEPVRIEAVGDRTWRITAPATNTGRMPTRAAMGVKANRWPPTRWELRVDPGRVLAGRRVQGVASVAPGAVFAGRWVVAGEPGERVELALLSPECGDRVISVTLGAGAEEERK